MRGPLPWPQVEPQPLPHPAPQTGSWALPVLIPRATPLGGLSSATPPRPPGGLGRLGPPCCSGGTGVGAPGSLLQPGQGSSLYGPPYPPGAVSAQTQTLASLAVLTSRETYSVRGCWATGVPEGPRGSWSYSQSQSGCPASRELPLGGAGVAPAHLALLGRSLHVGDAIAVGQVLGLPTLHGTRGQVTLVPQQHPGHVVRVLQPLNLLPARGKV